MTDDRVCTKQGEAAVARLLVRQITVIELKEMMESGTVYELVDVRTEFEWSIARIEKFRLLDQDYHDQLCGYDKDTPMIFQCHHGIRSQQAAEYFRQQGFRNLYNVQGGIDAWSQSVDPTVRRY
jgi:monothiol glutaredoxin